MLERTIEALLLRVKLVNCLCIVNAVSVYVRNVKYMICKNNVLSKNSYNAI